MILHPLFHWSPSDRRNAINKRGLMTRSRPQNGSFKIDYICLSLSPSMAWALSAGVFGEREQQWDCWQISLDVADEVRIREFWGNKIEEIQVYNCIPKSRIWLVGTREVPKKGRRY